MIGGSTFAYMQYTSVTIYMIKVQFTLGCYYFYIVQYIQLHSPTFISLKNSGVEIIEFMMFALSFSSSKVVKMQNDRQLFVNAATGTKYTGSGPQESVSELEPGKVLTVFSTHTANIKTKAHVCCRHFGQMDTASHGRISMGYCALQLYIQCCSR